MYDILLGALAASGLTALTYITTVYFWSGDAENVFTKASITHTPYLLTLGGTAVAGAVASHIYHSWHYGAIVFGILGAPAAVLSARNYMRAYYKPRNPN